MIKKNKLVWLGLFLLVGQLLLTSFFIPPKAHAATVDDLRARGRRILKLEAFRRCVDGYLTNDGIDKGDGPFNLDFAAGDSIHATDKAVGHGIDKEDGRWDCGSDTGNREDAWFKLILRNGSDSEYYSGWDDGDNGYADYKSRNVRDVVGDDHPDLYFINPDNKSTYNMDVERDAVTGRAANKKLFAQIDRSIKKQEEGLSKQDKDAMRYIMLSDTFFSPNGCAAAEADPNSGGDKVKIGNTNYTVNNDGQGVGGGEVAAGHGNYAMGDRGTANCKTIGEQMAKLRKNYEASTGDTNQQPPGSNPDESDGAAGTDDISFQCSVSINPLTWLMCPLITAFAGTVNALDKEINAQLLIDTDRYLDDKNSDIGNNFREVWVNVRNIALAFLVIVGLVMVISTAVGSGPFDAYTVKKLMPRILFAIIGISLSWTFVKFAIDITNSLGLAVRSLIQSPFKDVFEEGVKIDGGQLSLGSLGVVAVSMSLGIWGVLSLAGTAALAVLIALAVLTIRQMLVILLAVLAPIAIVAYILPNTKKMGSLWWDFFSKALLTFPIISAFIAIGRVFAVVGRQVDDGLLGTFITFVAYFGPYFALPTAFRLAGGAIAQIGGMANDRSKGAFDRLSKFRSEKQASRVKGFREAGVYNSNTRRGRVGNKIGGYLFDFDERVPYALGKEGGMGGALGKKVFGGRAAMLGSKIEHTQLEQSEKLFQQLNKAGANDKAFRAISGATRGLSKETRDKITAYEESHPGVSLSKGLTTAAQFEAMAHILGESSEHTERVAATALHRAMPIVTNATRNGLGYGDARAAGLIGLAAHGFATGDDLADVGNHIVDGAPSSGKHDAQAFAEAALVQSELYGVKGSPDIKAGYGHAIGADGRFVSGTSTSAPGGGRGWDVLGSLAQGDLAGAKSGALSVSEDKYDKDGNYIETKQGRLGDTIIEMMDVAANGERRQKVIDKWRKAQPNMDQASFDQMVSTRISAAESKSTAIKDELFQLASRYSQAPIDSKTAALKLIERMGEMKNFEILDSRNPDAIKAQGNIQQTNAGAQPGQGPQPPTVQPPTFGPPGS